MDTFYKLEDLKKFDNLELLAKKVVEGYIVGMHKSPLHGFSAEERLNRALEEIKAVEEEKRIIAVESEQKKIEELQESVLNSNR